MFGNDGWAGGLLKLRVECGIRSHLVTNVKLLMITYVPYIFIL